MEREKWTNNHRRCIYFCVGYQQVGWQGKVKWQRVLFSLSPWWSTSFSLVSEFHIREIPCSYNKLLSCLFGSCPLLQLDIVSRWVFVDLVIWMTPIDAVYGTVSLTKCWLLNCPYSCLAILKLNFKAFCVGTLRLVQCSSSFSYMLTFSLLWHFPPFGQAIDLISAVEEFHMFSSLKFNELIRDSGNNILQIITEIGSSIRVGAY